MFVPNRKHTYGPPMPVPGIPLLLPEELNVGVRFEVFKVVTMKNGVFWDVTPCGSSKNRRLGGT
jgi:hypothetical protein